MTYIRIEDDASQFNYYVLVVALDKQNITIMIHTITSIQKWEEPQKFPPTENPGVPGKEVPGLPVIPPSKPQVIPQENPEHTQPREVPEPEKKG